MPRGNAKETERRICTEAVRLFNERGYDDVSLRDIAKAAGTTIGNMTYHFAKKEDLLIKIVEGLHRDFDEASLAKVEEAPMDAFVKSLSITKENRAAYPFYYRHMNQIIESSEQLAQVASNFEFGLYQRYLDCLWGFRDAGYLQKDIGEEALELLAMLIISLQVSWIQPTSPAMNDRFPRIGIAQAIEGMLMPYLSAAGVRALQESMAKLEDGGRL